ncbi:hypothetical protein [Cellulomonas rhizosphaerae]|uniref:hypothetical protein n=1 Tax=Cellulomonas rhizosphaerae TaxID=2293719 RepID=UPI0013142E38|nr:hypothetical protein [Cellulomonas rhizosphaerae]
MANPLVPTAFDVIAQIGILVLVAGTAFVAFTLGRRGSRRRDKAAQTQRDTV